MNKTGAGVKEFIGDKREEILRLAERHGAYNVRVFGSVARGEARPGSDLDLLVEMREGATMWDLVSLWQALTALMGHEVNVLAEEAPNDPFMQAALKDAVPL